jgi:hypothetical protein
MSKAHGQESYPVKLPAHTLLGVPMLKFAASYLCSWAAVKCQSDFKLRY